MKQKPTSGINNHIPRMIGTIFTADSVFVTRIIPNINPSTEPPIVYDANGFWLTIAEIIPIAAYTIKIIPATNTMLANVP